MGLMNQERKTPSPIQELDFLVGQLNRFKSMRVDESTHDEMPPRHLLEVVRKGCVDYSTTNGADTRNHLCGSLRCHLNAKPLSNLNDEPNEGWRSFFGQPLFGDVGGCVCNKFAQCGAYREVASICTVI